MNSLILLMLGLLLILIFLRVEVAFALGITSFLWVFLTGGSFTFAVARLFEGINNFVLLAIPFFLFAGELMNRAKITEKLIMVANVTVGRLRGGLAQANVGGSLLFAGITGAGVADVAALGSVFIPSMKEEGYSPEFSAAVTAASALVGPIIPPSIIIVIYGAVTGVSIGGLFAAAIIPGVLLSLAMFLTVSIFAHKYDLPRYQPNIQRQEYPQLAFDSLVAATMPAIIVFGIVFGIFTPTEAAAAACSYSILIGVAYRTLNIREIFDAGADAIHRSVQIYFIIAFASIISYMLATQQVPDMIATTLVDLQLGAFTFLLFVVLLLLFIGTWLEGAAAIVLLGPTLWQVAQELGIEAFQFGIIFVLSVNFGLITPPLGLALFVSASISKVEVLEISKSIIPFFLANLLVLLMLLVFEELTLFLPRVLGA